MDSKILVLDEGYVSLITTYGSDEAVIEAARMSTNKGFKGWEEDERLLSFLYKNRHMTPFEMCGAVLEVKAPIFVFREWHRHRTQSYNEMSARYIPLPNENYRPEIHDLLHRSAQAATTANKQAQGSGKILTMANAEYWLSQLDLSYECAQRVYDLGLGLGVPKEIARLTVPVGRYSRMRVTANLRNWLQFLDLRMAPNAQQEIRQYARAVCEILSHQFPRTIRLFMNDGELPDGA